MTDEENFWEEETEPQPANPLEQLTGPAFNQDESLRILGLVAVTVVRLAEWPSAKEFTAPYDSVAQMAVDRISLAGLQRFPGDQPGREQRYPRSLPDLLAWCRDREVQTWNFLDLPAGLSIRGRLLDRDTAAPTRLCQELALRSEDPDPAGKSVQDLLLARIREIYEQAGNPGGHVAFIGKLVESPVLSSADIARLKISRMRIPADAVATCYVAVHDRYFDRQERANICWYCGLLRIPMEKGWRCEIHNCPDHRWRRGGKELDRADGLYHVARPLREFLVAPRRIKSSNQRSPMAPDSPRDVEWR
ncbi:hypothetical protein [Nonomuraea sp. NPDC001023]|uniref:pPIWI_RE_Y domain-containing protein n=1 Tax=unclassified Nonomuraea TaxID=2593643 RepID=UPI0033224CB5